MRNISDESSREKAHILCSITFFFLNRAVYEIKFKKYFTAGQATDDNMVHAH